ncbi:MAG: ABC transporter permease [Dehalococcoidia bacterium]|nr:ABC transporter permease [Dehalococcoidia bacterium]
MTTGSLNSMKATAVWTRRSRTLWGDAWRRLLKNRLAIVGGTIVVLMGLLSILAPIVSPYDPIQQSYDALNESASSAHWFGTDRLGRDQLSRLIFGARTSMTVGLFTQFIVVIVGVPLGAIAGFAGGRIDNVLMRFTDVMYAFPDLLLIILLRSALSGTPLSGSIYVIFFAIGLASWVGVARLMRGQILCLKERDFVLAARALGASNGRVLFSHLFPNALAPIVVAVTFGVPRAIFAEAALSYIGIGVTPPEPSWGTMIQDGYQAIFAYPHMVLFPGIAIALLMMAFTFLGDGLRDALDPWMPK